MRCIIVRSLLFLLDFQIKLLTYYYMDIQPRFKVGDKVTYKSKDICRRRETIGRYYFGGNDQDGYVGEVKSILGFIDEVNCYKISVSCDQGTYAMIESEFIEYDIPTKPKNGYFFEMVVNRRKRLNSLGLKPRHIKKYY